MATLKHYNSALPLFAVTMQGNEFSNDFERAFIIMHRDSLRGYGSRAAMTPAAVVSLVWVVAALAWAMELLARTSSLNDVDGTSSRKKIAAPVDYDGFRGDDGIFSFCSSKTLSRQDVPMAMDGTTPGYNYPYPPFGGYGYGYGGYDHGHGHHDDDHYANLLQQIAKTSADIVQATQSQNLAAIAAVNAAAQAAQEIASETRSDVNRIEGAIELAQSQSEARLGSAIERNGGDTRMSVERNGGDTRASVERNGGEVRTTVERNSAEIRQNISDGFAETRREIADGHSDLTHTVSNSFYEVRNQSAVQHAAAMLEIERTKFATVESRAHLERQAAENIARIQHEAERNKFELAKQMAECCCELKEHIHGEGERTRMLIEKNEIDRLREQLEHARREVDHHRHNEAVRVSVSQYVSQRQYGVPPVTPAPVAAAA